MRRKNHHEASDSNPGRFFVEEREGDGGHVCDNVFTVILTVGKRADGDGHSHSSVASSGRLITVFNSQTGHLNTEQSGGND